MIAGIDTTLLDLRDLAKELDGLADLETDGELAEEDKERLATLRNLDSQLFSDMANYAENEPTMIEDSYFEEYARGLAFDLGYAAGSDDNPLMMHIDWEGWAESVKQDYQEVEFDDTTYLIRVY